MRRLLNNLPIRVLFTEDDGEGGGGKGKGENMVPQSRVNELTAKHTQAMEKLQKRLDELEASDKARGDQKLKADGKLQELLDAKDKELGELKIRLVSLEGVEKKFRDAQTGDWKAAQDKLKKDFPEQFKKMQAMSAFRAGDTPEDVEANLNLYRDLDKGEFFVGTSKKPITDTGRHQQRGKDDKSFTNPTDRMASALADKQ